MRRRELLGTLGGVGLAGCLRLAEDSDAAGGTTDGPAVADVTVTPTGPSDAASGTAPPSADHGAGGDWPQPDYDAANTGFARSHSGPADDPDVAWQVEMGEQVGQNGIVVAEGTAFVPDARGTLDALALPTGERRWRADVGESLVNIYPSVDDGRVFVPSKLGSVTAFSTDGRRLWEYRTADPPINGHYYVQMGGVTAVDGTVFVGSGDGVVHALTAGDGDVRWRRDVGAHVGASTPAVVDGSVYVADVDGRLHALTDGGDARWTADLPGTDAVISAPAVGDGTVYVGGVVAADDEPIEQPNTGYISDRDLRGRLHAVDAASGDVTWSVDLPDAVPASPTVTDDLVVTGCRNGRVYAYTTGGERYWFFRGEGGGTDGTPVAAGQTVYLGVGEHVHAVDLETGRERWRVELDYPADATPAVVDGGLLVGDHRDPESGEGGYCYLIAE